MVSLDFSSALDTGHLMATYFLLGMVVYSNLNKFSFNYFLLAASMVAIVANLIFKIVDEHALIPAYCYLVLYIGIGLPKIEGKWISKNDLSYGLYVLHFPLIQFISSLALPKPIQVLLAVVFIPAMAFTSWKLIEKRAIAFGKGRA